MAGKSRRAAARDKSSEPGLSPAAIKRRYAASGYDLPTHPAHVLRRAHQRATMIFQQLLGEPAKARDVGDESTLVLAFGQGVDTRLQDGDGRLELVGGVGQEALVAFVAFIEPHESIIDGGNERFHLPGDAVYREAHAALVEVDLGSVRFRRCHAAQRLAHDEWDGDAGDEREKRGDRQEEDERDDHHREEGGD